MSWKLLRKHTEISLMNDIGLLSIAVSLQSPPAPNWAIGQELGYAKTRFQELVNLACLAFAENYRNGELVDLLE